MSRVGITEKEDEKTKFGNPTYIENRLKDCFHFVALFVNG